MLIVTGGAGFIGSVLLRELNARGRSDILVVDHLASTEKWQNLVKAGYIAYMARDEFMERLEFGSLQEALAGLCGDACNAKLDGVVHLGACSSTTERDADFLMANNVRFSQLLCEFALRHGARFIQASSAATYGDGSAGFSDDPALLSRLRPLNMYGYSKHLFDLWAYRHGLLDKLATVKFFNVYGPNEYHKGDMRSMVMKSCEQIRAQGRVALFKSYKPEYEDGGQVRDFIYVKDCARVLADLLELPDVNGVFNLGTGKARSWVDLALAVFAAMGEPERIDFVDMPEQLQGKYQYYTQADMTRLETALALAGRPLSFYSLEDGVADYVRGYLLANDQFV